jgi:AsmA protein
MTVPRLAIRLLAAWLVLLCAGAAYLAYRLEPARLKQDLADYVFADTQRTLKIDGDLDLVLWPDIALRLSKVTLSERASPTPFARVDSARVVLALRPLLSRQRVVPALDIQGLQATVIRHRDGTLNIDDLLASDPHSAPLHLDVADAKIAASQLVYRDEAQGSEHPLDALALDLHQLSIDNRRQAIRLTSARLAGTLHEAGTAYAFQLDLSAAARNGTQLQAERVAVTITAPALQASLASPLAIDLAQQSLAFPRLVGQVDIARPHVAPLRLPLSGMLEANLEKSSAQGTLNSTLDGARLELRYRAKRLAPLAIGFDLDLERLDLDRLLPPAKTKSAATGESDLTALKNLDLDGTVRIGELQAAGVKAGGLRLHVKSGSGRLQITQVPGNNRAINK